MKNNMLFLLVLLALGLVSFSSMAKADLFGNSDDQIWYIDAGVGIADLKYQYPNRSEFKEQASFFSLGAGINFLRYFSLELNYYDFGAARDDIELDVSQGSNSIAAVNIDLQMFVAAIVGHFSVGESVSLFGKVGLGNWTSRESISGLDDDDSGTSFIPSIGVDFAVSQKISVVADLLFLEIEPSHFSNTSTLDLQLWSLGIKYSF